MASGHAQKAPQRSVQSAAHCGTQIHTSYAAVHHKNPMHYSASLHKLKLILAAQGIKTGDAGAIDTLFGGKDGYYWFGTVRDMCPEGKTLSWENQYAMVHAIQAHENATAEEDEMKPQVPSAANIAALSKLLADPL